MLVCAPTGSGKTNVAMLTILHQIGRHLKPDGSVDTGAFKIVYVAPMKVCGGLAAWSRLDSNSAIISQLGGHKLAGPGRRNGRQLWISA